MFSFTCSIVSFDKPSSTRRLSSSSAFCKSDLRPSKSYLLPSTQVQENGVVNGRKRMKTATVYDNVYDAS